MRNLIVFADGTGQDGGTTHNTNVYRMFALADDRSPHQLCYYHPGVGTSKVTRLLGLASGFGFGGNVRACYEFLHEEYRSGDRIFLIGFSRGAATVRSLAYFIHLFGILPRSRKNLIDRAWNIYTTRDAAARERKARELTTSNPTMWTKVHFLGCYDTVSALGAPYQWASRMIDRIPGCKHRFHDMRLSPSVVHAYHAVALDDERKTFHPLLWDPIENERRSSEKDAPFPLACETLRQVWFAGMHTDVGGGYTEQELSDIPLTWMTRQAVRHGLRIYPTHRVSIEEDANGHMHDSREGVWKIYRRAARTWDRKRPDRPVLHASVLSRTRSRSNQEGGYTCWLNDCSPEIEPWHRYHSGEWGDETVSPATLATARPLLPDERAAANLPESAPDAAPR